MVHPKIFIVPDVATHAASVALINPERQNFFSWTPCASFATTPRKPERRIINASIYIESRIFSYFCLSLEE